MNILQLVQQIQSAQSYLCIGLDTDIDKLPHHLKGRKNAVAEFNKAIIDATKNHCVSYKVNTAFYESQGSQGWQAMEETLDYIPNTHFTIADAKRGDIGNTAAHYAKTFFEVLPFDAVTVNPYMGADSVRPFLEYDNKVTILLGLTSNKGAHDFEMLPIAATHKKSLLHTEVLKDSLQSFREHTDEDEVDCNEPSQYLYEAVLKKASTWGTPDKLMFVIGATQAEQFLSVRKIIPDHFLLVPGVGAQGGSLEEISQCAMNKNGGILVNVSRAVIYAGNKEDFAEKAAQAAKEYQLKMASFLPKK